MSNNNIIGLTIKVTSKKDILEKIIKYLNQPRGFFHIVSINPENLMTAFNNKKFKHVVNTAQIQIIDGVGIILASKLLNIEAKERVTGVDLMNDLLLVASQQRLRVLLIGGKKNLADRLAKCQQEKYPQAMFLGTQGVRNIYKKSIFELKKENDKIFAIVTSYKPHLIFVAYGTPYQEMWLWNNRNRLRGRVCMGVGGAFDYLSGDIPRAPRFFQKIGLEWLFRLIIQPWRITRQLRLIQFTWLILKQRLSQL